MKIILIVLLLIQITKSEDRWCNQINVASDAAKYKDDITFQGTTVDRWLVEAQNPIIIGPSKEIDYIYVNVENFDTILTKDNFSLEQSNQIVANSTFKIDRSKYDDYLMQYAVEIIYHCLGDGGSLVDYTLRITVPDCGDAEVSWKKLCGNPIKPREGLNIDLVTQSGEKQTILKDGKRINSQFFDADVDQYAFRIPADQNKTYFNIYMSNLTTQLSDTSEQIDTANTIQTKLSKIKVDSDESICVPTITGSLMGGGYVSTTPKEFILNYNCKDYIKEATVELTIPLDYYKDVSFFLVKQCGNGLLINNNLSIDLIKNHSIYGHYVIAVVLWIFMFMSFYCIFVTIYNILAKKKRGLEAIPGLENSIRYVSSHRFIQGTKLETILRNYLDYNFYQFKPVSSNININAQSDYHNKEDRTDKISYGGLN